MKQKLEEAQKQIKRLQATNARLKSVLNELYLILKKRSETDNIDYPGITTSEISALDKAKRTLRIRGNK